MTDVLDLFETRIKGRQRSSDGRTITEADVVNFAGVAGDFGPVHVDEMFAARTPYGGRIAHGLLTLSVATTLASQARGFRGKVSYGYDGVRFVAPVMIGDTIYATVAMVALRPRGDGVAILEMEYRALNQRDETVAVARHLMLIEVTDLVRAWAVDG